jgi:hypothetical protein
MAASSDDAEEAADGGVNLTSSDLELVDDYGLQTARSCFARTASGIGCLGVGAYA